MNGEIVSSGDYKNGEVVVDKCFSSLDKVEVRNPTSNGWSGSVSASRDGKGSYQPFTECAKCVPGRGKDAIVVDHSSDRGKAACNKGAVCELHFFTGLPL